MTLFSNEIYWFGGGEDSIHPGPGLNMPHPIGILIGARAKVGANVSIYNNISMGTDQVGLPWDILKPVATVSDGATATLMGPYVVARGLR